MNKLKLLLIVLLLFGLAGCDSTQTQDDSELVFSEEGCDFRMLKWGMSEEEVEQAEGYAPIKTLLTEKAGYTVQSYGTTKRFERTADLIHTFINNRYVRGEYRFKNTTALNYQFLRNRLIEFYGQPTESKNLSNLTFSIWHFDNKIMSLQYIPCCSSDGETIKLAFIDLIHPEALDKPLINENWLANFPNDDFRFKPTADFRGVTWGASLKNVIKSENHEPIAFNDDQGTSVYDFGYAVWCGSAATIKYFFEDDQCTRIGVYFEDTSAYDHGNIYRIFYHLYGQPDIAKRYSDEWQLEDSIVKLTYSYVNPRLFIYFTPKAYEKQVRNQRNALEE